jgi:hypothetical protein
MSGMKHAAFAISFFLFSILALSPCTAAQTGSIEFVAHAIPSAGVEEPVRGFPFYLLSKSFEEIAKDAAAGIPKPDLNAFIDKLDKADYSEELKAWMKKHQTATLGGSDFIAQVKPADVMGVPEFYRAYMDRNAGDQSINFPKPKFKPSDKVKNPEKYKKLDAEYQEAIRHYIEQNPQSIDGIDLGLSNRDPSKKWADLEGRRTPEIQRKTLQLAQTTYLVKRTETDIQGQGFLRDVRPGNYWLGTLDVAPVVGDARPRWDMPVTVRADQVTRVSLTSFNAIQPSHSNP